MNRFLYFCRRNNVDVGLINAIPLIGPTIRIILFNKKKAAINDQLANEVTEVLTKNKEAILSLESFMSSKETYSSSVVTVGSGNAEHILTLSSNLQIGQKQSARG